MGFDFLSSAAIVTTIRFTTINLTTWRTGLRRLNVKQRGSIVLAGKENLKSKVPNPVNDNKYKKLCMTTVLL